MLEKKQERLEMLIREGRKIQDDVRNLTENLEQKKNQLQQIQGHINECSEMVNELKAEEEKVKSELLEQEHQGEENG